MATRVSVEHVYKMMRKHTCRFWELYEKDATNIDEMQDDDTNVEDSILKLQSTLDDLSGNTVNITISEWAKKRQGKGGRPKFYYEFCIMLSNAGVSSSTREPAGSGNIALLTKIKDLEIENLRLKMENDFDKKLEKLRLDLEGNKKTAKVTVADKVVDEMMPILRQWMKQEVSKGQGGTTTINALDDEPPTDKVISDKVAHDKNLKRVSDALMKWKQADANFLDSLETVAQWALTNPTEYRQYLPMIKESIKGG